MTPSLRLAVATMTALLAAGFSNALAQSSSTPTQKPSRQAKPSPDQDASREPPEAKPTSASLFDNRTKPGSISGSWLSDVDMRCLGCRGFGTVAVLPESSNPNAPRVLQGTWRHQTTLGVVSTGLVGVRNYALPLYVGMPLGGDFDPGAQRSSRASSFAPSSQWYLTAGIEKTLATSAEGTSIGVTADVLIPVETNSISVGDPRIGALKSRAARFGIVLRW